MQVSIVTADIKAVAESRLHSTSSFKHCPSSKTNKWMVNNCESCNKLLYY